MDLSKAEAEARAVNEDNRRKMRQAAYEKCMNSEYVDMASIRHLIHRDFQNSREYQLLDSLSFIDWSRISPETRETVDAIVRHFLELPARADVVAAEARDKAPEPPPTRTVSQSLPGLGWTSRFFGRRNK